MNGPKAPFGYVFNEETQKREIVPEEIAALDQAYWYYRQGCGLTATRNWLVTKTGRNISIPGLLKAFKHAVANIE